MPHNFLRISAETPNPGRRKREHVQQACEKHDAKLEYLWFDDEAAPSYAYVLVKDGDVDKLAQELQGQQVIRLFEAD